MKTIKRHYHWVILVILFTEMIVYGGIGNSIGVFTIPIVEDLGISRGTYALTGSVQSLVGAVSTVLAAAMFRKFGYRRSAIFALAICAGSYIMRGLATDFGMLLFARALYGIAIGSLDIPGATKTVINWFHKHKGVILGFVSMATGLGGSVMSIVMSWCLTNWGWRVTQFICAGFYGVVILLYLLVRDKPEHMDLAPYGEREASKKKEKQHPSHENWHGRSTKELFRTPHFYLMSVCTFMVILCAKMSSSMVIPHFQDMGFSAAQAALFNSVLMLCLAAAKLGCGELCDLIGAKVVAVICVICLAAGQFLMAIADNLLLAYASMVLLSVGLVMWTIMIPLLTKPLFGYASSDALVGIFVGLATLSGMFSEPIANYAFDIFGSYSPVFYVAAAIDVALVAAYLVLFKICAKDKMKYLKEEEVNG